MNPKAFSITERMIERIEALEAYIKELGDVAELKDRLLMLEEKIYLTKRVFYSVDACDYMGISDSLLYKLTSKGEIPHYKPRGKMIYFDKEELEAWLMRNNPPVVSLNVESKEGKEEKKEEEDKRPYFKRDRYSRRRHGMR